MEALTMQVRPTWAAGVDLRQTMVDCVQVVGDVDSPLALRGAGANGVGWLDQLDGSRSWSAQLAEAEARGIARAQAREVLRQLFEARLLVDAPDADQVSAMAAPAVLGSRDIGERIAGLVAHGLSRSPRHATTPHHPPGQRRGRHPGRGILDMV